MIRNAVNLDKFGQFSEVGKDRKSWKLGNLWSRSIPIPISIKMTCNDDQIDQWQTMMCNDMQYRAIAYNEVQ